MTRTSLLRPTLLPGLPRVWRDAHTLQLGLDPARAVLLELADPRAARILDLLDGTRPERVVVARASADGLSADDTVALIDALHGAGFVLPAPSLLPSSLPDAARRRLTGEATALALSQSRGVRGPHPPGPAAHPPGPAAHPPGTTADIPSLLSHPPGTAAHPPGTAAHRPGRPPLGPTVPASPAQILRRRIGARVVISGRGRLAAPIAVALAEAGVGHVDPDVPGVVTAAELAGGPFRAADVGRPRAEAIADAIIGAAPETETHSVRRGGASLVVQLGFEQPVALLAASHVARRQAHLAMLIREGTAVIGPLVPPTGAPCLSCIELHRRDRDPSWPTPGVTSGNAVEPCTVATVLAATAFTVGEVLEFLAGGTPQTLGAAVEISGPGRFRRRTWPPHPGCTCAGRRRRSPETVQHMARHAADRADPGG